ncbi:hypothetical protein QAD02_009152 [Eretmocerus hayati]|uniref:Uncharacterized protein n=1 Tax=Eretmocerus hayati TaxID=131215 RepID=A0ACC2NAY1_9HYME|nr:hypothetical protein QAD02_009152 [Eretmocerus hayati]
MLSRNLNAVLRLSPLRLVTQLSRKNSTAAATDISDAEDERDPAPYFFKSEVQELLKTVTRPDPDKVFRRRLDGRPLQDPEYQFMTDEQLEKALKKAEIQMWKLLQIPPFVKTRRDDVKVLSYDPAYKGFTDAKYVFTDISFGIKNKDRIVAVREPDGTLRTATFEERDRVNQIYFPIEGREVDPPKMFLEEHLQPILDRGDFEFVLDRACIQFEPDSPDFKRVSRAVYEKVNAEMLFDKLRSTRHYGSLVFYLAWNKNIDDLLLENVITERLEDAALVIKLYSILNPSDGVKMGTTDIETMQNYLNSKKLMNRKLDQAFKMYLEIESERKTLKENIAKAHGKKEAEPLQD